MSAVCARQGCIRKAEFAPSLLIPAIGHPGSDEEPEKCIPLILGLALCREHCDEFGPIELPEQSRERIRNALRAMGKADPDFDRAEVRSVPIDSGEYQAFLAANARAEGGGRA